MADLPNATVRPFEVRIDDREIADLRERLERTRWPDAIVDDWSDGTDRAFLRELVAYWRDGFDWRAREARINAFPHVLVRVGEIDVHAVVVRGNGPAPLPLVVTHGWPGSFVEMLDLVPRLTDPVRFGGDARDAFDVVVPSLPGYGFSGRPTAPGMTARAIASMWVELMEKLGYDRFGAQGGDWGSCVSTHLGIDHPERLVGVHLNYMMRGFLPARALVEADGEPDEIAYLDDFDRWSTTEGGYAHLQGTKPQTLAYGLTDSPAGLAAYIVEKFRTWSDCDGDLAAVFSNDTLLTNIAIYWFTRTIGPSMHLYWERQRAPLAPPPSVSRVPFGFAAFPKELSMPPRRLLERVLRIERYTTMPRGGHFAALEEPERLANDIAAFFRPYR